MKISKSEVVSDAENNGFYTVFRKKHPLTFSFISPCVTCRFKQNCSEYT